MYGRKYKGQIEYLVNHSWCWVVISLAKLGISPGAKNCDKARFSPMRIVSPTETVIVQLCRVERSRID